MNPEATTYRCWPYCRTKHIVPLNWSFYLERHGLIEGFKNWHYRRTAAEKHGYRALYFQNCDKRLREFVRLDPWEGRCQSKLS